MTTLGNMHIYSVINNHKVTSIASVMGPQDDKNVVIRYQGFLILKQPNHTWLVRPERSPMRLLPFRTASCSLKVILWTFFDSVTVFVGASTDTIETYFCTYSCFPIN